MRKLYKLVLKAFSGPLVITFFISLFVLLMQFLWKYIDDLVGKGLEWYVIGELLFYASATFVPMALPLSILLSSLMTFGDLGEKYELVAMKAAGISLKRVMIPLIVLTVFISIGAFFFSNNVMPIANLKFRSILYDVREHKMAFNIGEGVYYHDLEGYVLRVKEKDEDGQTIRGVIIYDHTKDDGNTNVTIADSGIMAMTPDKSKLVLELYSGENYVEDVGRQNIRKRPFRRTKFQKQTITFDMGGFDLSRTNEDLFKNNYHMLNLDQLQYAEDSLNKQIVERKQRFAEKFNKKNWYFYSKLKPLNDTINSVEKYVREEDTIYVNVDSVDYNFLAGYNNKSQAAILDIALTSARKNKNEAEFVKKHLDRKERRIRKYQVEWHRKFTLSIACLLLFFIGAPLGAIIRKGGLGFPLVVSIGFFVFYHILSITGEKYVKAGVLPVWEGMWLASIVLFPLGLFLVLKATTDAPILDADGWRKMGRRLVGKKKGN
ncbi:MAG: LptF/LptG family permease [Bacteroidota bacterium]|nr:LptF/LptG family permease [Bacteroidota bacterium]